MTTTAAAIPIPLSHPGVRVRVRTQERSPIVTWGIWLSLLSLMISLAGLVIGFTISLGMLTALGFFVAILGLNKPGIGLIGISMLCTMDNMSRALLFTRGPFPWNTFNYWLLLVLLLSVIQLLKFNDPQTRIMQLLTGLLLFGLVFSPMLDIGEETILNIIAYFSLLMYFYKGRKSDEAFYWQGMVSGFLGAAAGLVYYIQMARLPYVNPNSWSYLPLTAIFAIALGFRSAPPKGKGQLFLGLLASVNFTWVFLSGSRGSLLTGLICMIFIIASIRKKSQRFGFIIIGGALIAAVIIAFGTQNQFAFKRLDKLFNENETMVGRTSGRSELMKGGWLVFQDNPFGVGTGGFATAWARLGFRNELTGFSYGENREAHAGWIKILAENGFLGFFVLVALVASFVVKGWQLKRRGLFPLGLFMTTVLSFAWVSTEFASKGIWFLVAGSTALFNLKKTPLRLPRRRVPSPNRKKA
jgi:O-antigen ligase